MPRKSSKRITKRNDAVLTWELHYFLVRGFDFFIDRPPDSELPRLWEAFGDYLLSTIGKRLEGPEADHLEIVAGTRPWIWWAVCAKEPRRLVSGDPANAWGELWLGKPRIQMGYPCNEYETETEYLARLDLWVPGEREQVHAREA